VFDKADEAVRLGYDKDTFVNAQILNWKNTEEFRDMSTDQEITL